MKKLLVACLAAGLFATAWSTQVAYGQDIQVCVNKNGVPSCEGYGSIQEAIDKAPANAVVKIPSGKRTEAEIKIEDRDLTIRGAGARATIVQAASQPCAVPGRVFHITSSRVTIEDLTIRYGCILNPVLPSLGAGIWNAGSLTLNRVIISENKVVYSDGAQGGNGATPWVPRGGGIYSVGSLDISNSTITTNTVSSTSGSAMGGGIYNNGNAHIVNSTISGNRVVGMVDENNTLAGGGVMNTGSLVMEYNTVVNNRAAGIGGAIANTRNLQLINNLFYANQPPQSEVICELAFPTTSSLWSLPMETQDAGQPASESAREVDLEICEDPIQGFVDLGELREDTPLPVYVPAPNSAWVDRGMCDRSPITTDQRGSARGQGNECDLGAVELGFSYMPVLASSPPMPDLIVRQVTIEPAGPLNSGTQATIKVVIENIGNKATEGGFYTDLFINPRETPPNHGGFTWAAYCRSEGCVSDQGIVWRSPLTLYPKEQFTFTSNLDLDEYALRLSSKWTKYFDAGEVRIWAIVDSYAANGSREGYIAERREDNNRYEHPVFTVTPGRLPDAFGSAGETGSDPLAPDPQP